MDPHWHGCFKDSGVIVRRAGESENGIDVPLRAGFLSANMKSGRHLTDNHSGDLA